MTSPSFEEFEATSLYCQSCRRAVPVKKKLLLVLPTGTKYDYVCGQCGSQVGGKLDQDPTEFRRTVPPPGRPRPLGGPGGLGGSGSPVRRRP